MRSLIPGFSTHEGPYTEKTPLLGFDLRHAGVLCYVPIFPVNVAASALCLATEPRRRIGLRFHALESLVLSVTAMLTFFGVVFLERSVGLVFGPTTAAYLSMFAPCAVSVTFPTFCCAGAAIALSRMSAPLPLVGEIAQRLV